jgi:hypothetical protein
MADVMGQTGAVDDRKARHMKMRAARFDVERGLAVVVRRVCVGGMDIAEIIDRSAPRRCLGGDATVFSDCVAEVGRSTLGRQRRRECIGAPVEQGGRMARCPG